MPLAENRATTEAECDVWQEAGLFDPSSDDAAERLTLLKYLTARGATIEQMVEAHQRDNLPAVAGDLVLCIDHTSIPVQQLSARHHISPERVERVLLAAGLPPTQDVIAAGLEPVLSTFVTGAAVMGEEPILAFTRVLGAAATNIAEAALALFYSEFGPGTGREGSDELARAETSERATRAFRSVPAALDALLLAHFDRASRRSLLARKENVDGTPPSPGPLESGEVIAIGFVDLVGSTAWTEGLTLRDHSLALSRFETAAWTAAVVHGGRVIKMIGDEVFFTAPTARAACHIAVQICRAASSDHLLPPARGALGYGRVTAREGDYFGPLVNIVSRLAKSAQPNTVLITEQIAASLPPGLWSLQATRPQILRGVAKPVPASTINTAEPHPEPIT